MTDLFPLPPTDVRFFNVVNAIWPDLGDGRALIAPPRNGMNRKTGKLMQGWDHVEQSLEVIFRTPFHERVLRRWVGSFVPHLLGESGVPRVVTRFFWAVATSIELWEPNYKIIQVFLMGQAAGVEPGPISNTTTTSINDLFRQGNPLFRTEGVYFPRGHLNDFTAASVVTAQLTPPVFVRATPAQLPGQLPPQIPTGGI